MAQVAVEKKIWNYWEIKGSGAPIIIMHGWGRSSVEWEGIGNYLHEKTGKPVLIPDLPGFGGTGLTQGISDIYDYTKLLVSWMKYLGIKKASFVGHSLGGRMGVVLGAQYPELVENLVLIAPAAVKPVTLRRVLLKPLELFSRFLKKSWRQSISILVVDPDGRNESRRELYKAVVKYDLENELPKIKSPTLVIWGEKDSMLPLALLSKYKKIIPNVSVRVIWEAGHDPHLTHLRELLRIVEEVWI